MSALRKDRIIVIDDSLLQIQADAAVVYILVGSILESVLIFDILHKREQICVVHTGVLIQI